MDAGVAQTTTSLVQKTILLDMQVIYRFVHNLFAHKSGWVPVIVVFPRR